MYVVVKLIQFIFLYLIKIYQFCISPWIMPSCRYIPSCSEYAKQCIIFFGPLKGSYLALLRVLKCNPFGGKGYDPIPTKHEIKKVKERNGTKSEL